MAHTVETVTGESLTYDFLLIASGARPVMPLSGAIAFTGSLTDHERLHGIVQDVEGGYEGLDEEAGRPAGLPVNVKVGDAGTGSVEVLSLH